MAYKRCFFFNYTINQVIYYSLAISNTDLKDSIRQEDKGYLLFNHVVTFENKYILHFLITEILVVCIL